MTPTAERRAWPSNSPRCPSPRWILPVLLLLGLLLALPASAEEPMGVLSVTGNVEGAEVWVDGDKVGSIPYTGYHPVGHHQVRVVADFYQPFVRRIELIEGLTKNLPAKLISGDGTVEFAVSPPGAIVHIDGNAVGPAPIRVRDLEPGKHSYEVKADGYEPLADSFTFERGRNLYFDLELNSSAGLFHVGTIPAGATVWIDGEQVGVTPLDISGVDLGEHEVRMALDGYAEVYRPVDTSDGRKGSLDVVLSDSGVRVAIKTGSPTASVVINGTAVGQGSSVVIPAVDRGTLRIQVQDDGFEPASMTMRVPASGRVTLQAKLAPQGGRSELSQLPPFYGRWTFWAATAAVAGGGVAGGLLLAKALEPPPPPTGDVQVVLP